MTRFTGRLAIAAATIGLAAGAAASPAIAGQHDHHAPAPAAAQAPDITDADFLGQAAQANRFEIVTGKLAAQRGRSKAVRRLGRQFAKHHTMALAEGSAVAAKLGVTPPPGLSAAQQATADKLAATRGRSFDRAWLKAQRAAHVEAVALHLRGALTGETVDVRTLAINALPVVAGHLGELTATVRR
jgi:putative membrane protein